MIEVFCTNITTQHQAAYVLNKLSDSFSSCNFTLDLEDCDKILRVENKKQTIPVNEILQLVNNLGIQIKILDDFISTR